MLDVDLQILPQLYLNNALLWQLNMLVSILKKEFCVCSYLCSFFFFGWFQDTVYINNKAKIISSDIVSTNGIIHVIDKLLSPQNLLITPKDASGRILVGELTV